MDLKTDKSQIAIDVKTLCYSYDGDKHTALHSITAWSKDAGINENASVLEMLDTLDIKRALISANAMNSQTKIEDKIHAEQGDYLLCIKNNQKKLRDEIEAYFHKVQRERHIKGKETTNETQYYISSLGIDPKAVS